MIGKITNKIKTERALKKHRAGGEARAEDASLAQWGVVGTGPMAERFARVLDFHKGVNIRSVSSRSAAKATSFAQRHGAVAAYEGVEEFAVAEKGKTNVVYIATPVGAHYGGVKACLENGLNVLCEKPLCEAYAQAKELYALADDNNAVLMEAMWSYCLPTFKKADEWLSAGAVGNLRGIEISLCKNEPNPAKSVLNDYGTYAIAFAAKFLGGKVSLANAKRSDYKQSGGIDCEWHIELSNTDGAKAKIVISSVRSGDNQAVIHCERGAIVFAAQFNRTHHVSLLDDRGKLIEDALFDYEFEGYEYQVEDALTSISGSPKHGFSRELSLEAARLRTELLSIEAESK